MAVVTNTTLTTDITVNVKELDFVTRFERTWESLREIMGIMRPIKKQAGTKLVASKATVTLQSGTVAEGDEVPLTKAKVTPVAYADLAFQKYRKRVTAEAVDKYGAEIAVQKTDDAFLNEITGNILDDFYTFLGTGTLTSTETTFQMAVAMAVTKVADKFKKLRRNVGNIIAFVNTLDVGRYLGSANISLQTRDGIQYLKDFLGANTVIVSSEIPEGKVIATPADNIVLYYADVATEFSSLGLTYTTNANPSGLIGVHKEAVYDRVSGDTHAILGMKLFAEYLDGIANVTISAGSEDNSGGGGTVTTQSFRA